MFPDSGIRDNLASFRNRESLPQLHLPQAFLRAAKGIEASLGKLTLCVCVWEGGGGVDEMLKKILLFNDKRLGEHLMSI